MNKVARTNTKQMIGVKTSVLKGSQNSHFATNIDANKMAELESIKLKQNQLNKRQKIESFMNTTRINASKLYKQKQQKNTTDISNKKNMLEKQRELKQKYTIIPKRQDNQNRRGQQKINGKQQEEQVQQIKKKPKCLPVNWKQAESLGNIKGLHIPQENCEEYLSEEESGYDSQIEPSRNQTPTQAIQFRDRIRSQMLNKMRN